VDLQTSPGRAPEQMEDHRLAQASRKITHKYGTKKSTLLKHIWQERLTEQSVIDLFEPLTGLSSMKMSTM